MCGFCGGAVVCAFAAGRVFWSFAAGRVFASFATGACLRLLRSGVCLRLLRRAARFAAAPSGLYAVKQSNAAQNVAVGGAEVIVRYLLRGYPPDVAVL